jgi:aldose 1-epimerase
LATASEFDEPNPGKSGTRYGKHAGVGLQCLGYPGGVSHPELGNIMLRPGQTRRETTAYVFHNMDA